MKYSVGICITLRILILVLLFLPKRYFFSFFVKLGHRFVNKTKKNQLLTLNVTDISYLYNLYIRNSLVLFVFWVYFVGGTACNSCIMLGATNAVVVFVYFLWAIFDKIIHVLICIDTSFIKMHWLVNTAWDWAQCWKKLNFVFVLFMPHILRWWNTGNFTRCNTCSVLFTYRHKVMFVHYNFHRFWYSWSWKQSVSIKHFFIKHFTWHTFKLNFLSWLNPLWYFFLSVQCPVQNPALCPFSCWEMSSGCTCIVWQCQWSQWTYKVPLLTTWLWSCSGAWACRQLEYVLGFLDDLFKAAAESLKAPCCNYRAVFAFESSPLQKVMTF